MPNFIERFENVKEHTFYLETVIKRLIQGYNVEKISVPGSSNLKAHHKVLC